MTLRRLKYALELTGKLFGRYKSRILILMLLGFISGFFESIGIGIMIPIFSLAIGRDAVAGNDVISIYLAEIFTYLHLPLNLTFLFILVISLFIFKAVASLAFGFISTKIVLDFETSTRKYLYRMALFANWPYLLKQKIGHLENTIMLDLVISGKAMGGISSLILDFTGLITYVVVAFNISRFITVITLLVGALLVIMFYPFIEKTRRNAKRQTILNKLIAHHINENFIGIKSIKASGSEGVVTNRGDAFFEEVRQISLRQSVIKNLIGTVMSPLSMIFIAIVFLLSYSRPTFNLAVFAATMYLIQRIFIHVNTLQKNIHIISDFSPHLVHVAALQNQVELHREKDIGHEPFNFLRELEFKNVNFSFENGAHVISDISFKIKKGETIGIIGPSGAGKTTTVDLILRLLIPKSGEILLDGKNINDVTIRKWRHKIGYVPQDVFLINDTIANNIKFYDLNITDEDMIEAAKFANIHEFIVSLDAKFDSLVGERGVKLSGGQKQRIALARTLARKPEILILDEATSALDSESEILIQKSIENLRGNTTVIIIAHRLSTIMNTDRLIALEDGKIKEIGKPAELLKNKASYFHKINAI